jgi:hypothetical protein
VRRARRRSDAQHPEKDQERFRRNAGTGALDEKLMHALRCGSSGSICGHECLTPPHHEFQMTDQVRARSLGRCVLREPRPELGCVSAAGENG